MSKNNIPTVVNNLNKSNVTPMNDFEKRVDGDIFNEWGLIGDSSFTNGFVIQSLRTNDQQFIQNHGDKPVKNITSYDISQGKGYASSIYKSTVYFVDETIEPYTTILKVPGLESAEKLKNNPDCQFDDDKFKEMTKIHESECEFYDSLAEFLEIPVPKVYKTLPWILNEKNGLIHMEDLSKNCKSLEIYESLCKSHVLDVTCHLAKMHKNMLIRKDWHGKYLDNQTIFKELTPQFPIFFEGFYRLTDNPEFYKTLCDKYSKIASSPDFVVYAYSQSWKDLGLDPVLVHGDLWGGNIMWKVDEYGHPTNKVGAFVDWQIMHEGSIMADLARVITMCTDGDIRRHLEEFIFDFYIDELTKNFKADGLKCPVTLEQIKKAYQFMFLVQAFFFPFSLVFLTNVDKSDVNPNLLKARRDRIILRTKHAFEDVDKIANSELKWVFDKYNV